MKILTLFTCLLLLIAAVFVFAASTSEYDKLCDEIVALGQRAYSYANEGDMDAAENTVEEARQVYKKASEIDPQNGQAAANLGVFLLNANKFNESISVLEDALEKMPDSARQAKTQLGLTIRKAKYGYASFNRDRVYQNGKGDLPMAYYFAQRQIEYTSIPHRTHHEAGTLASVLCEYDDEMCRAADNHLRVAFAVSHSRYIDRHMPKPGAALSQAVKQEISQKCMRSRPLLGSWAGHPKVTTKTLYESIHIHEIKGHPMVLNGRDGVITFPSDPKDCSVLAPASDNYIDLASNLFDPRTEEPFDTQRPSKKISEGMITISALQYHSHSFYHWLAEVIPRLVIASIHWEKFNEAVILVPKLTQKERFITESISLIFQDRVRLAEYHPNTQASQLTFVSWNQPTCNHKIGPCHALANELALLFARNEIVRSIRRSNWKALKYSTPIVVFAMRGKSATMRRYNEHKFLVDLEKAVQQRTGASVVAHDSGKMTFGNAMAVYRQAAVVVGVHGGAMANIIACAPGTSVVEVGFTTAAARHYAHMSQALALDYHFVEVEKDLPLKRGMSAPEVQFDFKKVIDLVVKGVEDAAVNQKRHEEEFERDTDPDEDPRRQMEEEMRRDKEAEAYFSAGGAGYKPDQNNNNQQERANGFYRSTTSNKNQEGNDRADL